MVPRAQELELEDHQSRLEQKLREKMAIDGKSKWGTSAVLLCSSARLCQLQNCRLPLYFGTALMYLGLLGVCPFIQY